MGSAKQPKNPCTKECSVKDKHLFSLLNKGKVWDSRKRLATDTKKGVLLKGRASSDTSPQMGRRKMIPEFSPRNQVLSICVSHEPSTLEQWATWHHLGLVVAILVSSIECANSSSNPVFIHDFFHPVLYHLAFLCFLVLSQCYALPRKSGGKKPFSNMI